MRHHLLWLRFCKTVLAKSKEAEAEASSYADILLKESLLSAKKVIEHLDKLGLATKPPEKLDGGATLGTNWTGSDQKSSSLVGATYYHFCEKPHQTRFVFGVWKKKKKTGWVLSGGRLAESGMQLHQEKS